MTDPGPARGGIREPALRFLAGVGLLAAGIIHLAQVWVHADEGVLFWGFFLVVGALQVAAAVALVRARRTRWYWIGIAGSSATIAIWLLSRSLGLPFGAEPGVPEVVGTADAAASLLEGITVVSLLLHVKERIGAVKTASYLLAAGGVAAMGGSWFIARGSGLFDPDMRLTGAPPELADRAVLVLVLATAAALAALGRPVDHAAVGARRPFVRGLLVLVLLAAVGVAALTLPARGGQNSACRYGPLAEVSGLTHAEPPDLVQIDVGEVLTVPVLELSVCGSDPLMLTAAEPLRRAGDAATLVGFDVPDARADAAVPAGTTLPDATAGALLRPGETWQLVAQVQGVTPGVFRIDSLRLRTVGPAGEGAIAFAAFLVVCTRPCEGTAAD